MLLVELWVLSWDLPQAVRMVVLLGNSSAVRKGSHLVAVRAALMGQRLAEKLVIQKAELSGFHLAAWKARLLAERTVCLLAEHWGFQLAHQLARATAATSENLTGGQSARQLVAHWAQRKAARWEPPTVEWTAH